MCEPFKLFGFFRIHQIEEITPVIIQGTIDNRQPHEVARAKGTATATEIAANIPIVVI